MKNKKVKEFRTLTQKYILEEATAKVWRTFEEARKKLDPESLQLFDDYLSGTSQHKLCEERGLTPKQLNQWVNQIKRTVVQQLRNRCCVRH